MAIKLSQGLCSKLAAKQEVVAINAATLALVDGGASADTITDSGSGFLTAGFLPGMSITIRGAAAAAGANDIDEIQCTDVTAGAITLPTGTFSEAQTAGTAFTVIGAAGGSLKNLFQDSTLTIYDGTRPDDADQAITQKSSQVVLITFPDDDEHILYDDTVYWDGTNNRAYIKLLNTLTATATGGGSASWFRLTANGSNNDDADPGGTAVRLDGLVASSGDISMSNTTVNAGDTDSIASLNLAIPQS